jgi:hypothetical protein
MFCPSHQVPKMPERRERRVVLRGGTVVDSTGERRADVVV